MFVKRFKVSEYWPGGKWQVFKILLSGEWQLVDEFRDEWQVTKRYPNAILA